MSLAKRKYISSDLRILYPAPKISNPNLNSKLRWHKILPLEPRNYFPFGSNLDLPWDWIFPEIPLRYSSLFSQLGFTSLLLSWGTKYIILCVIPIRTRNKIYNMLKEVAMAVVKKYH